MGRGFDSAAREPEYRNKIRWIEAKTGKLWKKPPLGPVKKYPPKPPKVKVWDDGPESREDTQVIDFDAPVEMEIHFSSVPALAKRPWDGIGAKRIRKLIEHHSDDEASFWRGM